MVIMDSEEKALYEANDFPVFAYSAQAKGFFSKYDRGIMSPKAKERYLCEESIKTYTRLKALATENGDTLAYTVLDMLCKESSFNVFPVIAVSGIEQLRDSLNIK